MCFTCNHVRGCVFVLQDEYTDFLNDMLDNNELMKKLLEQVDGVFDATLPTWSTHGKLMVQKC